MDDSEKRNSTFITPELLEEIFFSEVENDKELEVEAVTDMAHILYLNAFQQFREKFSVFGTPEHQPVKYKIHLNVFERLKELEEFQKHMKVSEDVYYKMMDAHIFHLFQRLEIDGVQKVMDTLSAFVSIDPEKYSVEKELLESSGFGDTDKSDDHLS